MIGRWYPLGVIDHAFPVDSKGFVLLCTPQRGKSFRVYRPPLIREVEKQWWNGRRNRPMARSRAGFRTRVGQSEFVALSRPDFDPGDLWAGLWDRADHASRRMAERIATCGGGVGQIYDEKSKVFETIVKEYLLAWSALLEEADPS